MRTILTFFILLLIFKTPSYGQKIEKIYLDNNNTKSNLYLAVQPIEVPIKTFLVLIPGFGETPEAVMTQTDLANEAAKQGILTIIPTLKDGVMAFGIDNASQQSLKEILENAVYKYKLEGKKFYICGFSIGGSCAIKFTEAANQLNYKFKPSAVFAIDPPLDFERFYNSSVRTARLTAKSSTNQEAVYMIDRIKKEMGGIPSQVPANYINLSPYSFSDISQTAIKSLVKTPVRIYTEPDVNWWIKERGGDFSSMNALDASCMINELKLLGNANAALITTSNKGFRKLANNRHPHSWSIVDNKELIKWLLQQ